MIKLFSDSRDLKYHEHYGQVTEFPAEFNVDTPLADNIQPIGDVRCTCYTVVDIAEDQTGTLYDITDLFNRVPHDKNGADPRDALGEACTNGLLPEGKTERIKKWKRYLSAHTGGFDPFDNVRSAMQIANSPIAVWSRWYAEWFVGSNGVMKEGKTSLSGHMYDIQGWKQVNGEPMLVVQAWQGYTLYMPRFVFNTIMAVWGSGTAILVTDEIEVRRKKTLIEMLIDACKNLVALLRIQQTTEIQKEVPIVPIVPVIQTISKTQQLYDKALSLKGKYLTLDPTVPKIYNCAETLSYILKECGYDIPAKGFQSTNTINTWLIKNFEEISAPEFGCIVVALTVGDNHGHVGIDGYKAILSCRSITGTLESDWSLPAFLNFYGTEKGLEIRYFRAKS